MAAQGVVVSAFGGPDVLRYQAWPARPPGPGEVRIRQTAVGVNYIDVYVRAGLYRLIEPPALLGMEAAGVVVDTGPDVVHLLPGDRVAYACVPPGAYVSVRTMPPSTSWCSRRCGRRDGRRRDAEGHDRRMSPSPHASRARGRDGPRARRRGWGRPVPLSVGEGTRRPRPRHRLRRGQGEAGPRQRMRAAHHQPRLPVRAGRAGRHFGPGSRRDLRRAGPRCRR